jgi:DNA-directed RNA polymerase subunit RPC12/RpoP
MMQIYHFTCKHCGYELKLPLGSSDLDQVLTDVNADYADYHLFRCDKESKFVYADTYSKDFEGKCIADGNDLREIDQEEPPVKCPRCTQDLVMETRTPFADDDDDDSS